jgi:2-dehydropantoate 2-reductase
MGAGGVGGYFGGLLAAAGEDVTFIARGRHLEAIRAGGLRVQSVHGDFVIRPAKATANPAEVGHVDLVLLATKTYHVERAVQDMRPLVGPETAILPLLNGVQASEQLLETFEPGNVLGGACWISSEIAEPGQIRQMSDIRRIVLGELDGSLSSRIKAISEALEGAGATVELSPEIDQVRWTKFLWVAPIGGIAAVARVPLGDVLATPETRQLWIRAMEEVKLLAEASGVILHQEVVARTIALAESFGPALTASMQRDIMAGRPSELEAQNGFVFHRGQELGVPTPVNAFIYGLLLPQEKRARAAG